LFNYLSLFPYSARKDTQLSVDQQLKELIENVKLDIKTIKADLIILEEIGEKLTSIEDYNLRIIRKLNQEYSTLLVFCTSCFIYF